MIVQHSNAHDLPGPLSYGLFPLEPPPPPPTSIKSVYFSFTFSLLDCQRSDAASSVVWYTNAVSRSIMLQHVAVALGSPA